jgi:hypothetical protein
MFVKKKNNVRAMWLTDYQEETNTRIDDVERMNIFLKISKLYDERNSDVMSAFNELSRYNKR